MPSMISPSPGMISPATTSHTSPTRRSADGTSISDPSRRTRAIVSARVRRRASACALPLPSATASAKLAKTTVIRSHATVAPANTLVEALELEKSLSQKNSARTDVTSTVNITGFLAMCRGLSFMNESAMARRRTPGSKDKMPFGEPASPLGDGVAVSAVMLTCASLGVGDEVLDDRAERKDGEVGQADDDHGHPGQERGEQRRAGRQGSGRRWRRLLRSQ